jgi:trigger factor
MQAVKKNISDTKVQLTLTADAALLANVKQRTLDHLAHDVKLPGFRAGKAPSHLVEKNINPATLQTEFLDRAMNELYSAALDEHKLRPVSQPEVKVSKFVPFDTLEIELTVEVVGDVKLPDYKKIKLAKKPVKVTAKDIDGVLAELGKREAEKKEAKRAAKAGDEVVMDFSGTDAKTKEAIAGTDGKDYPLTLGSNSFIPGFEEQLVGLKAGDEKSFDIVFPKDYHSAAFQNRKVTFAITVKKVNEIVAPTIDDAFAAKAGPFKNLDELKADVKKQLESEKQQDADRLYADELIKKVTDEATVALPESLIDEQVTRLVTDQKQNILYRGQTWPEFLKAEGKTEEEYLKSLRPDAELRVKAGLVLAEIAGEEKVQVTPEELDMQMQLLRGRYSDKEMQAELEKPETRREIASRIISEKTINKLVEYAAAK